MLKLGGKQTTKPFPASSADASLVPVQLPSLNGYTKINHSEYVNTTQKHMIIMLTAAATSANSGFNFNGWYNGQANFIVPLAWTVDWEFKNMSRIPHSCAASLPGFNNSAAWGGAPHIAPLVLTSHLHHNHAVPVVVAGYDERPLPFQAVICPRGQALWR